VLAHLVEVYSMRIRRVSRMIRTARGTMSAAMNRPASASACWKPVNWMTSAATITPREPRASLSTSRKAAFMLRLESLPPASTRIATRFASRPTTPKTSSSPEAISGGAPRRRMPSTAV
jgi:hypothetical protein